MQPYFQVSLVNLSLQRKVVGYLLLGWSEKRREKETFLIHLLTGEFLVYDFLIQGMDIIDERFFS